MNAISPLISVVIPTYNRRNLLKRAIASMKAQVLQDWQLIVVDDGSDDGTASYLAAETDPRIATIFSKRNGAATARNLGASQAISPYLTFLDSDDEAEPTWLLELHRAFTQLGGDIVTTGYVQIHPDGRERTIPLRPLKPPLDNFSGNFVHSGSWAVKTPIFHEIGGFADGLAASQHTELSLRLLPKASAHGWKVVGIDTPLIRYYVGYSDGIRGDDVAVAKGAEYIIDHHGQLLAEANPRQLAAHHAVAGVRFARLGFRSKARYHITRSIRYHPSAKGLARLVVAYAWVVRPRSWRSGAD